MKTKIWVYDKPVTVRHTDTIKSTRRLHSFCTFNGIRDALIKSQGGWYFLQRDGTLKFVNRTLDSITFEEYFNLIKKEDECI